MRCQSCTRRWKSLAAAGLLSTLLFLPASWLVGATPDCGDVPPEPHPEAQRTRLLARLGVDRWHAAGYRGRGIKIALLDSGFRGYRIHLGAALPAQFLAHSFRGDPNPAA